MTGLAFCGAGCLVGALVCQEIARAQLPRLLTDPAVLATTLSVLAPALLVACVNAIGLSCWAVLDGLEQYSPHHFAGVAATVVFVAAILVVVPAADRMCRS